MNKMKLNKFMIFALSALTIVACGKTIGSTMISEKDGATLVYVPAGEFTMGSDEFDWEKPVHKVTLDAFWIDQTEVTNKQYAACVDAGKCEQPSDTDHFSNSGYANHPVVYVDWNKAKTYCEWAGRSLPTDAQWEKAARGTDGQTNPWGNDAPNKDLLNYNRNIGDTIAVKSYESGKSIYGAYDMAGNVWEWASSLYKPYPCNVNDGREDMTSLDNRALRGGSWNFNDNGVRSAYRNFSPPAGTVNDVGFRCARSLLP